MVGNENSCTSCRESVADDQFYVCDSCLGKVHKGCLNLTASEIKCMPLQKRLLLLICTECRKLLARLPYIIKVLDEIKEDVEGLKQRNATQEVVHPSRTYAGAVQGDGVGARGGRVQNIPTLIIKPKNNQDVKQTREEIYRNVNPAELKVGIKSLRTTKQGGVVVKCATERELNIFKEAVGETLGHYEVKVPELKPPKIKIVGYTGQKTAEEIEDSIRRQNDWVGKDDKLKITYMKRRSEKNVMTIFAECSPGLFHTMMDVKRMYIDWERCVIYEDLSVTRCFNCQGFNHKNSTCKSRRACKICSGEHDSSDCQDKIKKCINCVTANSSYRKKYDVNHTADDASCQSYCYQVEMLKSKINYNR